VLREENSNSISSTSIDTLIGQLANIKLSASFLPNANQINEKIDECLTLVSPQMNFNSILSADSHLKVNPRKIVVKQKEIQYGVQKEMEPKFKRLSKKRGPKVKK
jgi:hypothetical protein